METRRLGRTEHWSSVAILGGAAFWDSDPETTERCVTLALDAGVNHIDVAPQYGRAQELLGPLIERRRDEVFVACKTLRHSRDGVRAQLEESLDLLRCDQFDLYQLHAVTDLEELDRRGDAAREILAARDEGLCRFVGITGHNMTTPAAQLEALRRYDLDTVMLPINPRVVGDPSYADDLSALLDMAASRDIGVMAIKAGAARPWRTEDRTATTWYEPYDTEDELERGIRFALSTPHVTGFCTPGDVSVLPLALDVAGRVSAMSEQEREAAIAAVEHEQLIFPIPT